MARPSLRREDVGDFLQQSVPIFSGILGLSTTCTAVLRSQKRQVFGDLIHCSATGEQRRNRANHLFPELQTAITDHRPPPGPRDLAIGQVWQVFSHNVGELAASDGRPRDEGDILRWPGHGSSLASQPLAPVIKMETYFQSELSTYFATL